MKISASESRVLDVLWRLDRPATLDEIAAVLLGEAREAEMGWSASVAQVILTRLAGRQAVTARIDEHGCLYRPLVERKDCTHANSNRTLHRLFDGRLSPFVTPFACLAPISDDEMAVLAKLVEGLQSHALGAAISA